MATKSTKNIKKISPPIIQQEYQKTLKILVIGDAGVGKTSIIRKYTTNTFNSNYVSTIGIDYKEKIVHLQQRKVRLQIWDTAGQERFHTITKAYYRGAQGLIIAFDITNIESFHHLQYWLEHISDNCENSTEKIIVGTKSDLYEQKKVKMEQLAALCQEMELRFIQVSSKTGKNIEELFETLGCMMISHVQESRESVRERMKLQKDGYEIDFKKRRKCSC